MAKTYDVKKRKEDGKWAVCILGSEKAIKLFDTKAEALEYTNKMAENQGASVMARKSKGADAGKFQKAKPAKK